MVNNYQQDEAKTKFSWHNLKRMMTYVKPYKKDFLVAFILGVIASIFLLFIPRIISFAIDVYFVEKNFLGILLLTLLMLALIMISLELTKIRRDKICIVLKILVGAYI